MYYFAPIYGHTNEKHQWKSNENSLDNEREKRKENVEKIAIEFGVYLMRSSVGF